MLTVPTSKKLCHNVHFADSTGSYQCAHTTLKSYHNGLLCVSSIAIGAISTGARKNVLLALVLEEMFY